MSEKGLVRQLISVATLGGVKTTCEPEGEAPAVTGPGGKLGETLVSMLSFGLLLYILLSSADLLEAPFLASLVSLTSSSISSMESDVISALVSELFCGFGL